MLAFLLAACQPPPPSILAAAGTAAEAAPKPAGQSLVGEACRYEPVDPDAGGDIAAAYHVYCGRWQQPSAHVLQARQQAAVADLDRLAVSSPWRLGLSQRLACDPPVETTLMAGSRAALLQCRRLLGGWPHVALVADVGSRTFYADGVPASLPAMWVAMASAAGVPVQAGDGRSPAAELIAAALAARPFGSNDLADFYRLRHLGEAANDAGDYAAAEQAFRGALSIHQRVLGPDDGALALSFMAVALQLSNQGKFRDAEQIFARSGSLLRRRPDPLAEATLDLYLAEHAANLDRIADADAHAGRAVQQFSAFVRLAQATATASPGAGGALFMGPEEERATVGLATSWWFQSYSAYRQGDFAAAARLAGRADALLTGAKLQASGIEPRALRVIGLSASGSHDYAAGTSSLQRAADVFARRQGNDPQAAVTLCLAAENALAAGDKTRALAFFRQAAALARDRQLRLPAPLVEAYLGLLTRGASAGDEQTAREGMAALQLIAQSETEQVLARALVRLSYTQANTRDLLRVMQDSDLDIARLSAERNSEQARPAGLVDAKKLAALDTALAKARSTRNDADAAAQAASPEYARLIETGVTAESLQAALRPNEALLDFHVGSDATYALLITANRVRLVRLELTAADLLTRINALRRSIVPGHDAPGDALPVFDTAAAHALYAALFGPLEADMKGIGKLVVVPGGPLAMLPLDVLVTAPTPAVTGQDYSHVPFLLERMAVSYTPSLRTFLIQRTRTAASAAAKPYVGFGDFRPASAAQLAASFPEGQCGRDLAGLKSLPPLPATRREISFVGQSVFHVAASDMVLGEHFTKATLAAMNLRDYRIVHLATHGLLPTDLTCRQDATIIVSPDPHAADAASAFLGSSDVLALRLDANLVLLSACNTGNGGQNTGDSLSALARSFFFAGARGLLVTHWELSDRSAPLLTAATLAPRSDGSDTAEALRQAKRLLIHTVAARYGEKGRFFTHPYAWAGFVLVGDGEEQKPHPRASLYSIVAG